MNQISKQAKKLLNIKYKKDMKKDVIRIYEILEHDGYDQDGPESNIYTFLIYNKVTNFVSLYTREYWFTNSDNEEYELVKTFTLKDFENSYYYPYLKYLIHS